MLAVPLWFAYVTLRVRFALLTGALIALTTVLLYVIACDPLPPCPGAVRDWIRGLLAARSVEPAALP